MFLYKFLTTFNFAVHSVFFGFYLWTFFWVFRRHKQWKFYLSVDEVDKVIVRTVIVSTIGNLLIIFYEVLVAWYDGVALSYASIKAVGPYGFGYWMNTFVYYMLPFLFLSDKIRNAKWFRLIFAFFILIVLYWEKVIIFIISLNRDYIKMSWTMDHWPFLATELLRLIIFIALIAVLLTIKHLRNKRKLSY